MQESFDPYREWLGIQVIRRPPDHYALLGLACGESDPQIIAHAADVQMARIRKIRPGAHLGEWSRLLDELRAAKTCLLDPAGKAAYDAPLHRAPAVAGAPPGFGIPAGPALATPPAPTLAVPPGFGQISVPPAATVQPAPTFPAGSSELPGGFPHGSVELGLPAVPQVQGSGGMGSFDDPSARRRPWDPQEGVAPPNPATPGAVQLPAVAGADWAMSAHPTVAPSPGAFAPLPPPPSTTAQPADWQQNSAPATPAAAFGSVPGASGGGSVQRRSVGSLLVTGLLLVLVVISGWTLYNVLTRPQEPADSVAYDPGSTDRTAAVVGPAHLEAPKPPKPGDPTSKGTLPQQTPGGPKAPPPPGTKPEASAPQPTDPGQPAKPPGGNPPPEDPTKRAAFLKAVDDARFSMGERDLKVAAEHLKTASANAQTEADHQRVARLETILRNLEEFWKGVRNAVAKLPAPGELKFKDTYIAIVDCSAESIMVKIQGRLRSWRTEEIPTALVLAIVEQSYTRDAGAKFLLGCFLAMEPGGDRTRARHLWMEAAKGGINVTSLLPELDAGDTGGPAKGPPGSGSSGGGWEGKVSALEQRGAAAQSTNDHREVAVQALDLLQQAVTAKRFAEASQLAELAVAAARRSKNPSLMKQAAAAREGLDALRRQ